MVGSTGASSKMKRLVEKWQKKLRRSGRSYASLDSACSSSLSTCPSDLERDDEKIAAAAAAAVDDHHGSMVVYVGKDKRRYVVEARHLQHPLFKSFVAKSVGSQGEDQDDEAAEVTIISCEVVMFEHLLWMLENYDPAELHAEAINELLDLYATG